MIQAPILPYIPQQQVPTGFQQPVGFPAAAPQQQYMPGAIYNYPTASSYLPTNTAARSQCNGVNIEIINPQGQGGVGMPGQNVMPAQYNLGQQPLGQYPFPAYQALTTPVYPFNQFQPQQVPAIPAPAIQPVQPEAVQPAPAPQIQQPVVAQPAVTPIVNQQPQALPQPQPAAPVVTPVVEQPVQPQTQINPAVFAGRLRTEDTDAQRETIEEIAKMVKKPNENELAQQGLSQQDIKNIMNKWEAESKVLLDTQIFDALVEVINKDTSYLEGPSPETIEIRQKSPDSLTPQERAKAAPTPLEKAEINKQYSLYTISYMQELLNNELEKLNGSALELKDLPCIDTVIDTVKSNQNPMLRIGAIAALSHINRPEYKNDLNTIFSLAKSDEDDRVREAATRASRNIND